MQNSHLQSDPCQTCLSDRSRLQIPPRGQPPGCLIEIFHSVLPFHCQHKHWSHRCVLLMTWLLIIIVNLVVFSSSDLMCQHGSLCPRMATVWKGSRPSSMKARATDKTFKRRKWYFWRLSRGGQGPECDILPKSRPTLLQTFPAFAKHDHQADGRPREIWQSLLCAFFHKQDSRYTPPNQT